MRNTCKIPTLKDAKLHGWTATKKFIDKEPDKKGRMQYYYDFTDKTGKVMGFSKLVVVKVKKPIK
jgi:hypothetical protein